MGHGLFAILVSARRLTSIPGSRNRGMLARVLAATRKQITSYDAQLDEDEARTGVLRKRECPRAEDTT